MHIVDSSGASESIGTGDRHALVIGDVDVGQGDVPGVGHLVGPLDRLADRDERRIGPGGSSASTPFVDFTIVMSGSGGARFTNWHVTIASGGTGALKPPFVVVNVERLVAGFVGCPVGARGRAPGR